MKPKRVWKVTDGNTDQIKTQTAMKEKDMKVVMYSCLYMPRNEHDIMPCGCVIFDPDSTPEHCKRLGCNFLRAFCAKEPMSFEAIKQRLEGQLLYDEYYTGDPYGDDFRTMKFPSGRVLSITKEGDTYQLECLFGGVLRYHSGIIPMTQSEVERLIEEQDEKLKLPDYSEDLP